MRRMGVADGLEAGARPGTASVAASRTAWARKSEATTPATSSESSGGGGVADDDGLSRTGGSMSQAARASGARSAEPSVVRRESGRAGTLEP